MFSIKYNQTVLIENGWICSTGVPLFVFLIKFHLKAIWDSFFENENDIPVNVKYHLVKWFHPAVYKMWLLIEYDETSSVFLNYVRD